MNHQKSHMLAVAAEVNALGLPNAAKAMIAFAHDVFPQTVEEWAHSRITIVSGGVPCSPYTAQASPFARSLIDQLSK